MARSPYLDRPPLSARDRALAWIRAAVRAHDAGDRFEAHRLLELAHRLAHAARVQP